jgi:hypothetical protein
MAPRRTATGGADDRTRTGKKRQGVTYVTGLVAALI